MEGGSRPAATHGTRAIVAALIANAGITVAKLVGFLLTGAASLAAEAVHSLADTSKLVGAKLALAPSLSFDDVGGVINEAETRMRTAVPTARVIYLEPDRPR